MAFGNRAPSTVSLRKQALRNARHGWRVLPLHAASDGKCSCAAGQSCKHAGKHPRIRNGVKDATTDRTIIKAWWNRWPNANIGIATGRRSGILVLDVDGKVGKAYLKKLQAEHGRLPKTVTVKTGRGRHRYFLSGDARIRNSVGNLGKGIDVRGDGGYVVAAGSVHVSGAAYRFLDGRGPDEIEVAAGARSGCSTWLQPRDQQARTRKEIPPIPPAKLDRARAYADVGAAAGVGAARKGAQASAERHVEPGGREGNSHRRNRLCDYQWPATARYGYVD